MDDKGADDAHLAVHMCRLLYCSMGQKEKTRLAAPATGCGLSAIDIQEDPFMAADDDDYDDRGSMVLNVCNKCQSACCIIASE